MTPITDRQSFADYCLRQLGAGVVNIEISDEQIDDNIDQAIQFYQEFHYDGIERDYIIKKITGTTFEVNDATGWTKDDNVALSDNSISAKITDITNNTISINIITGHGGAVFKTGDVLTNGTTSKTISNVVLGDADSKYITVDDTIVGVKRVLNINRLLNTTQYIFDVRYQIMMNEIRNLTSGGASYLYGLMQYLGHLEHLLNKEKDFRFNRRMNKLYLDLNWGSDLNIGDYITIEVYKALDEVTYGKILNDRWLKRYASALFKRQWGTNLKKYSGMQLPGGVTYDGQQIYNEEVDELKVLEQEAIEDSAPLEFMMG